MKTTWTEVDFDVLGWHDVHVHGMRFVSGEQDVGELWLDLDYIIEWLKPEIEAGNLRFRIAPAILKFLNVSDLSMSLDYSNPGAAMGPFALEGIEREPIAFPNGDRSYRWTLTINWPSGKIVFESPGFSQTLTGSIVETDSQQLDVTQRCGEPPVD